MQEAIAEYDEAIRLDPQYADAYYNRGLVYEAEGKKAEAIADFEQHITLTNDRQSIKRSRQLIEELSKWCELAPIMVLLFNC